MDKHEALKAGDAARTTAASNAAEKAPKPPDPAITIEQPRDATTGQLKPSQLPGRHRTKK